MTYNASERRDVRALAKQAKTADFLRREFLAKLMSDAPGRAWMHDRLLRCHIFSPSYTGEALSTAFAEGERNIGLMDVNDIMAVCPDRYVLMMQEANARSAADTNRFGERARGEESDGGDSASADSDAGAYAN